MEPEVRNVHYDLKPTPNVIDGPIENEFAIINAVLEHKSRIERKKGLRIDFGQAYTPGRYVQFTMKTPADAVDDTLAWAPVWYSVSDIEYS